MLAAAGGIRPWGSPMFTAFRAEAPTWAALTTCYALFALLTSAAPDAPAWLVYPGLAVVLAFHSSLQHEAIHGHPTRWPPVNEALVALPLSLAYPFRRYRETHLAHHRDARLTDPYDDPESWYLDPEDYEKRPVWMKGLLKANNAALGRMLIGPGLGFVNFVVSEIRLIRAGRREVMLGWALHALGAAPLLLWLGWCGVSPVGYALACYGGLALISLRSFLEHRAEERASERSAIVEDRGPLALLYLNNNLHAVHHAHPEVSWHRLPALYAAHRERFRKLNGGYVFRSYAEVLSRHALKPKEPAAHPMMDRMR